MTALNQHFACYKIKCYFYQCVCNFSHVTIPNECPPLEDCSFPPLAKYSRCKIYRNIAHPIKFMLCPAQPPPAGMFSIKTMCWGSKLSKLQGSAGLCIVQASHKIKRRPNPKMFCVISHATWLKFSHLFFLCVCVLDMVESIGTQLIQ